MYLLNEYCCYLYGSPAWSFSDSKTSTKWLQQGIEESEKYDAYL